MSSLSLVKTSVQLPIFMSSNSTSWSNNEIPVNTSPQLPTSIDLKRPLIVLISENAELTFPICIFSNLLLGLPKSPKLFVENIFPPALFGIDIFLNIPCIIPATKMLVPVKLYTLTFSKKLRVICPFDE